MIINLVVKPCHSLYVLPHHSIEIDRAAIGVNDPCPDDLQAILRVSNLRVVDSNQPRSLRNQKIFACRRVVNVRANQSRAEGKDYRDIAALLENGISLPKALAAAKAIYGDQFEPRTTLRALSYFADGDLPKLPASIQNALRTAATEVKLDQLPVLVGKRDLAPQGKER